MKIHLLKLNINFCDDVLSGKKSFEIRKNDRGFQTGDIIKFIPCDNNIGTVSHKIAERKFKITYILNGWGIKNDYVVLSIKEISGFEE